MDLKKTISILSTKELVWNRVDAYPCVYTFYECYYINLCRFTLHNEPAISINVDDVGRRKNDLIMERIVKGGYGFNELEEIYNKAIKICNTVPVS